MERNWIYVSNPILKATNNWYSNAFRVSVFHLAALEARQSDPLVATMLATYHPIHETYVEAYSAWRSHGGTQKSQTVNLKKIVTQLRKKIIQWDVFIQTKYAEGTPEYVKLLPHNRIPFQRGAHLKRLIALTDLNELVAADASLTAIKDDVHEAFTEFSEAFEEQAMAKTATSKTSEDVEKARVAMCGAQFANYGGLIQKYSLVPEEVERFFDLEHIRRKLQDVFTHLLKHNETRCIVKRKVKEDASIELSNTGNTELFFFRGNKKDAHAGAVGVVVAAGDTVTVPASQLGDAAHHFYIIRNNDSAHDGSFEVYFK
jgi:hypothetical protein